jgi:hypothetical protein
MTNTNLKDSTLTFKDILNQENDLYKETKDKFCYGKDLTSYRIAGNYLSGKGLVEDWGCGTTFARQFIGSPYRGVDGSWSKWADEQVSLIDYKSKVPKILMRHVLEHNWEWRTILKNMLESFTDRAVLILFLKPMEVDTNISFSDPEGIPGLALCEKDLEFILKSSDVNIIMEELETNTPPQNYERIYFLEKI